PTTTTHTLSLHDALPIFIHSHRKATCSPRMSNTYSITRKSTFLNPMLRNNNHPVIPAIHVGGDAVYGLQILRREYGDGFAIGNNAAFMQKNQALAETVGKAQIMQRRHDRTAIACVAA